MPCLPPLAFGQRGSLHSVFLGRTTDAVRLNVLRGISDDGAGLRSRSCRGWSKAVTIRPVLRATQACRASASDAHDGAARDREGYLMSNNVGSFSVRR